MVSPPAYCRPVAFEAFRRELAGLHRPMGLLRAASAVALHACPEGEIDADCRAVERLASTVRSRVRGGDDRALLAHLHDVMFEVVGFAGNPTDYYDPGNSFVGRVLQTRCGIPISLALIYRTVASQIGLRVEGVNTPGHFLAAVTLREAGIDRTIFVDPFNRGTKLNEAEIITLISSATGRQERATPATLAIAAPQDWLLRILRNLQGVYAQRGQMRDLLAMQELQSLLE